MNEDEKSENQIVSLGDLLRDGISVSSLAMSIKDKEKKNIYHYDRFGCFVPAGQAEKTIALKLLEDMFRWSVDDYDFDYEDSRSPLELYDNLERNPFDTFGWYSEQVPDFDHVHEDSDSNDVTYDGEAKRKASDKFVAAFICLIAEISKRAALAGEDFDPLRMTPRKKDLLDIASKYHEDLDLKLSAFDSYLSKLCKFQHGKQDTGWYRKLFPEYFKGDKTL